MKILVTDRNDFTPEEIAKLGVDMVAHVGEGDAWPRWLTELGIEKHGEHEVNDPEPREPAPSEPDEKTVWQAGVIAALVKAGAVNEQQSETAREELGIVPAKGG